MATPPILEARKKWGLCVETDCYTEVTREATEDQWDADDILHNYSVRSTRPCSEHEQAEVVVAFEPKEGMLVHLVVVHYSTGDSFHREEGLMHIAAAFVDERLARWAAESIQVSGKCERIGFISEDGGIDKIHVEWSGYFESLESVSVQTVTLAAPKPSPKKAGFKR